MTTRLNASAAAPRRLFAAAVAAGTFFIGLPALANDVETVAVPVYYSPAALKTDAGARAVYAQLDRAARQACGQPSGLALQQRRANQECREQAVARAVEQIGSSMLAAVHAKEGTAPRLAGAGDLHTSR